MPWHFRGAVGDTPIICTGVGCKGGWIPCPVDHKAQPFNEEWQGETFFRCTECDWIEPDEFGENSGELAGTKMCPECEGGERNDTYNGPCEFCGKKKRPAEPRTFPEELHALIKKKRLYHGKTAHACVQCFNGRVTELRTEYLEAAARQAYTKAHEAAGDPVGTCDKCKRIDYLAVTGPDLYACFYCTPGAGAVIPSQRQAGQELAAPVATDIDPDVDGVDGEDFAGAPPGFYDDPEEAGYLRWWSGYEWVGDPVHPDHLADNVNT